MAIAAVAPGPRGLPFVGHAPAFLHDKLGFLARCAANYGPSVELNIGGPTYLLTSPDDVKHVLVSHAANYEKTPRLTGHRARRFFGEGLTTARGPVHLRQRRMLQPVVHRTIIARFAELVPECTAEMTANWIEGTVVDIHRELLGAMQRLTLKALFEAEDIFAAAVVTGALSVDAARGSDTPFDARIQQVRGQPGQIDVAAKYRALLAGSEIRRSHLVDDDRVQDPYSLRCQPQVMGACLDLVRHVAATLAIEANAVTDNPLVFAESGEVLSGGNFHGEPVALAADVLALGIAEIGALSERRIALLIDESLSGLPPFLVRDPGINSGFMMAHVTAAALASENKLLAHPASVDSLPTSANQEDHVSMSTFAARRLGDMTRNSRTIVAIELLAAAQGIDFRAPLKTSEKLQAVHGAVRKRVAFYAEDRYFAPDIAAIGDLVGSGALSEEVADLLPSWN